MDSHQESLWPYPTYVFSTFMNEFFFSWYHQSWFCSVTVSCRSFQSKGSYDLMVANHISTMIRASCSWLLCPTDSANRLSLTHFRNWTGNNHISPTCPLWSSLFSLVFSSCSPSIDPSEGICLCSKPLRVLYQKALFSPYFHTLKFSVIFSVPWLLWGSLTIKIFLLCFLPLSWAIGILLLLWKIQNQTQ